MAEEGSRALLFEDLRVFDGARVVGDASIAIDVGVFKDPQSVFQPRLVRIEGATMIPGVIDAHVHIDLFDPAVVLSGGVTSARDLGWPTGRIRELASGVNGPGPDLLYAGPMLTAPGGYPVGAGWAPPGTGLEVDSPDQAEEAVAEVAAAGASIIKVALEPRRGPVMTNGVLQRVVSAAHENGLQVTAHLSGLAQLEAALTAGVDELAHCPWTEEPLSERLVEEMVTAGMVIIPTLHIEPTRVRLQNLRLFLEAGGKAIYGTDMGNQGPPPGIDPEELSLMVSSSMAPEAALASATEKAALHLGLDGRGGLKPGMRADAVLVAGDPLVEPRVLAEPLMVLKAGQVILDRTPSNSS